MGYIRGMISIEAALSIILKRVRPLPGVKTDISLCRGRVLAEDISAPENIPPFSNTAVDGYAVQAASTRSASPSRPRFLRVVGELAAGRVSRRKVGPGQALRIMTGAPIPAGADAVVMVEDTDDGDEVAAIYRSVRKGENVRRAGESARKGSPVLRRGKVLRPAEIGMLAALGYGRVKIVSPPRVAILSTGNELVEIGKKLGPGRIRDCNRWSLAAAVEAAGGVPVILGRAGDRMEELKSKLRASLDCNAVITSGGVSMGRYDLVGRALEEMGGEVLIRKVRVKPGKPLSFGVIEGKPFFGLPGNPVSVLVSFLQFVRPALLKMQGRKKLKKPVVEAVLSTDLNETTDRVHLVRAVLTRKNGLNYASPTGPQGSGILRSLVLANALLIIPAGQEPLSRGEKVRALLMDSPEIA
jgi:molybdopterin molybdotransferase